MFQLLKHYSHYLLPHKMNWIYSLLFLFLYSSAFSQTLIPSRSVDWTLAGLRDTTTTGFIEIDMLAQGAVGNGNVPNDSILDNVLLSITGPGAILNFPTGNYLFNNTIDITSNVIIRGQGADQTTFTMDLGGTSHSFSIQGSLVSSDTTSLTEAAVKDSSFMIVSDPGSFSIGNWVQIVQYDSDLVTSSWAENSVGQILRIKTISNNKIVFESPFRMDFDIARSPYIVRINPVENVGIECLKIQRMDDTAPEQSSNLNFKYAVNSWVNGIESENCTFSHIQARRSSNIYISKSYFHHAFGYGGNGRAYGVMLHATSNECLVENNIFEHLRHSMIAQSGANGNVFAYNYSVDPYWESTPENSAGDMVIHGNYPYSNLFEQNICQNIVIDNSHGPNGPYNTFFRNRSEGYGIFFSASNSPNQNFLGNEITNDNFPYNLINYTLQGSGHFIHGNNNKGTIHPAGTEILIDSSYAYSEKPDFITMAQWVGIGTPNMMGATSIPAYDRYDSGTIFNNACGNSSLGIEGEFETAEKVVIFPNPVQSEMAIESSHYIRDLRVINSIGQEIYYQKKVGMSYLINTADWKNGAYFVFIHFSNKESSVEVVTKSH